MLNNELHLSNNKYPKGIYINKGGCYDFLISKLIAETKNVLFIYDDNYSSTYELNDLSSHSVYKILKENLLTYECQMPLNKFIVLAHLNAIDFGGYSFVIFRLDKIFNNFALTYANLKLEKKSYFFLKETKKEDPILLGLPYFNTENSVCVYKNAEKYVKINNEFINYRVIIVEPAFDKKIDEYLPLKSCIKDEKILETLEFFESVSYMIGLEYIKKKKLKTKKIDKQIEIDEKNVKSLLVSEMKFRNLLIILSKFKQNFVIVCENENLFEILKKFDFSERIFSYQSYFFGDKKSIKYQNTGEDSELLSFLKPNTFLPLKKEEKSISRYSNVFEQKIMNEKIYSKRQKIKKESTESSFSEDTQSEKEEFILIFYDYKNISFCKKSFSKIFYFKEITENFNNFIKMKRNEEEGKFLVYKKEKENFKEDSSVLILRTHFYLLKKYFEDYYLFFNNIELVFSYETIGSDYICQIILPYVHENVFFSEKHSSKTFNNKKSARNDLCLKIIKKLKEENFMDDKFLPTEKYFQKRYLDYLKKIYNLDSYEEVKEFRELFIKDKCKNFTITEQTAKKDFKTKYSIDLIKETEEKIKVCYPHCLTYYPEEYNVYLYEETLFDDFNLGLCCAPNSLQNISKPKISFLFKKTFKKEELILIFFFQMIFFGLHFKKLKVTQDQTKSCYLILPIKNRKIDFNFLKNFYHNFTKESVYETKENFENFLLFNPINKLFYMYKEKCNNSILEKIVPCSKTIEDEETKYFVNKEITHYVSFADFFEEKYNLKLRHKNDDPNLLFVGSVYVGKEDSTMISTLSSEILYVTCVRKDLAYKFEAVTKFVYEFQNLALAQELKDSLNLKLKTENIKICLTPNKGTGEENYERFEFLGDSFLKFLCSKENFFKSNTLKEMVLKKDELISNDNLCKIAHKLNIPDYYSIIGLTEKTFQPPNLFSFINKIKIKGLDEYISYFKFEKTFQSARIDTFCKEMKNKLGENVPYSKKVYADIIEALIGMHYHEFGIQSACDFIFSLKIFDTQNESISKEDDKNNHILLTDLLNNSGSLSDEEINEIEQKINYKFNNKGILEKVILHPSYQNNKFGSKFFQSLELLGDCSLDLIVTIYIFKKYPLLEPAKLHCVRKGMVNNFTLARVLNQLGLFSKIKTSFSNEYIEKIKTKLETDGSKINKLFADVFEALCGAILVDCNFELDKFELFVKQIISNLEECADFTR
ncbi:dicer 4 [Tubulinosema ratisbonensis]|uniref:Dicer 4 n=1 Tax=Tubulinosema ratisbonensis TaxID=291195 RepID=A0A437APE6_9MICR|nr:dicer 4 [Tubulinosema ratisbonensis]